MPNQPMTSGPIAADEPSLTDDQIVERVRAGDRPLYELLMRRYNQRLYRIIRGILGNEAETEDALQESYLNAFEHLDQFRGEAKFSTWLTRIAVHEASRRSRRRLAAPLQNGDDPDGCDPSQRVANAPERAIENIELRQVLTAAIDHLPAGLRSVVMLREVQGLDTAETAECLGISESNVRIQLHRTRGLLQREIDERLGSEVRKLYQFGNDRCDRVVHAVMQRINEPRSCRFAT